MEICIGEKYACEMDTCLKEAMFLILQKVLVSGFNFTWLQVNDKIYVVVAFLRLSCPTKCVMPKIQNCFFSWH